MSQTVWFSHKEDYLDAPKDCKPNWTQNLKTWDFDNCTVSAQRKSNDTINVIIRSINENIKSKITNKNRRVRFFYRFEILDFPKPFEDKYDDPPKNRNDSSKQTESKSRWVLNLTRTDEEDDDKKNCQIWQWRDDGGKSAIQDIWDLLDKAKNDASQENRVIESAIEIMPSVPSDNTRKVLPIIYQPAMDTMKNFIRQIHIHNCKEKENEYEVTIVFNNEELRKHVLLNDFYEGLREHLFGRTKDVETFRIILVDKVPENFAFTGIYSDGKDLIEDDVHGDKQWWWHFGRIKKRPIKSYYSTKLHPKIFVNTSNHAMAGRDSNPRLWKWEYLTWEEGEKNPIIIGELSREDVEKTLQMNKEKFNVVSEGN